MKIFSLLLAMSTTLAFAQEGKGSIKVYDAKGLIGFTSPLLKRGKLVLEDGVEMRRNVPEKAYSVDKNMTRTRDYFALMFNRNSWDDKGADIVASVNVGSFLDILGLRQNAAWLGNTEEISARYGNIADRFIFGKGKDQGLSDFEGALDVIAHEYTHAVISTTSNLNGEGEAGALNEHLADVFGVLVEQYYNKPVNPFFIGERVLNGPYLRFEALRDLLNPEKGVVAQPRHMNDLKTDKFSKYAPGCKATAQNDSCGVHVINGIPNRASALIMQKLSWEDSAKLFYTVMTSRLQKDSSFKDYADALKSECANFNAATCLVVEESLAEVGL